jgi:hypothetical protein
MTEEIYEWLWDNLYGDLMDLKEQDVHFLSIVEVLGKMDDLRSRYLEDAE